MSAPNVEGLAPTFTTGGSTGGTQIGLANEALGFFGVTPTQTKGTAASNGDTLAHLVTYLTALGLLT